MSEPTRETPAITPEVTTAPAGSAWSRIPDHLGPARTSTVILGVLFLGLFALYLYIRPETVATTPATTGNAGAVVEEPATPTTAVPETTAPQTTTAPDTTRQDSTPTTTATTSEVPSATTTTTPSPRTTRSSAASTPPSTTAVPSPTLSSPTG